VHARDGATDLCHIRPPCLRDKRNKYSGDVVVAKMNRRIGKPVKAL
jgi:hypothetical protein